jgi:hypothetical protein
MTQSFYYQRVEQRPGDYNQLVIRHLKKFNGVLRMRKQGKISAYQNFTLV